MKSVDIFDAVKNEEKDIPEFINKLNELALEKEYGESKYGLFRLFKLSYKLFFALLSIKG